MTDGTWLRRSEDKPPPHYCNPPSSDETGDPLGAKGDVWRCDVTIGTHWDETPRYCGRRWMIHSAGIFQDRWYWARRFWPWPRSAK